MSDSVELYDCIGVFQPGPVTGDCTGCGRPLNPAPKPAREVRKDLALDRFTQRVLPVQDLLSGVLAAPNEPDKH